MIGEICILPVEACGTVLRRAPHRNGSRLHRYELCSPKNINAHNHCKNLVLIIVITLDINILFAL